MLGFTIRRLHKHRWGGSETATTLAMKDEQVDSMPIRIELCKHFTTNGYPNFRPVCKVGYKASLKCHRIRKDCKDYTPSL